MKKYKGKYLTTVYAYHVGLNFSTFFTWLEEWGEVQVADVGKQIYQVESVIAIENTEQMISRLLAEHFPPP
jgi:hypothetical protein